MRHNLQAAREVFEERTAEYSTTLWAQVPVVEGTDGPYASFPAIVHAAIVGRDAARAPARQDLGRFQPPDFDVVAVAVLAAWFLDYNYFRFCFDRVQVARLFGQDPVSVDEDMAARLSVAAAQFLCGYEEEDPEKRTAAAPLAALAIKEAMWGGPLPEEWL